jgi:hypothetical protein
MLLGTREGGAVEVEDGDIGTSTVESLSLIEVDGQGKMSMQTRFDLEDEDAALGFQPELMKCRLGRRRR